MGRIGLTGANLFGQYSESKATSKPRARKTARTFSLKALVTSEIFIPFSRAFAMKSRRPGSGSRALARLRKAGYLAPASSRRSSGERSGRRFEAISGAKRPLILSR